MEKKKEYDEKKVNELIDEAKRIQNLIENLFLSSGLNMEGFFNNEINIKLIQQMIILLTNFNERLYRLEERIKNLENEKL